MTVILVGIPGSGKTSLLEQVQRTLSQVQVFNYAEEMLNLAKKEGLNRDTLRTLPFIQQQQMGFIAAQAMAKKARGITIVDTHACVRTHSNYFPGIPLPVLQALQPKALALVQCSPEQILVRRSKDHTRRRDAEEEKELLLHQELTRNYLVAASTATSTPICIIDNESADIAKNAEPLIQLLHSFS